MKCLTTDCDQTSTYILPSFISSEFLACGKHCQSLFGFPHLIFIYIYIYTRVNNVTGYLLYVYGYTPVVTAFTGLTWQIDS